MRVLFTIACLGLITTVGVQRCGSSQKDKVIDAASTDPGETSDDPSDSSTIMSASSPKSKATTALKHSDPLYYAPFNFAEILQFSYTPGTRVTANAFTARKRYMLKSSLGNYLTIGSAGALSSTTALATYADTFGKIFEAITDVNQSTWFALDSELHNLYSLDSDASGNLSFANNRGSALTPTSRGFVVFSYDATSKLLQAKARYSYDLTTFTHSTTADASFPAANYYVKDTGSTFILVAASGNATPITLEESPINVSIPADFNPDNIAYQTNSAVPIKTYINNSIADMEGSGGKVYQGLSSSYQSQITAIGDDTATAAAASTLLNTIETSLTNEGAKLRYPKALYLAYRKAALSVVLKGDGVANGTLGMHNVPYVYFTNETDSSGTHHPFMVVASYSISDKPNRLLDVDRPPGDGSTPGYATQRVTRDATLQLNLVKIPLRDYGLVSALEENTLLASLNSAEGTKVSNSVYNYASTSGIGVAVDGVIIYPLLNNTLATTHNAAEITSTGIHVGQGMGLHYHADGHSALNSDFDLYNILDYEGQSHPPMLGFGLDGVALFGIYESLYPSMEGYSTSLDSFGGHTHGSLGYHYHSHRVTSASTGGKSYTAHIMMKGAWKGTINAIPEFWDTAKKEPAYSLAQRHKYVGKP